MSNHLSAYNTFTGIMDQDSNSRFIAPGNYIEANNLRNVIGGVLGDNCEIRGNIEVEFPKIPGDAPAFVLGAVEDKICNSIVYFVYRSRDHFILRYFPEQRSEDEPDGHITEVMNHENLFFFQNSPITGAVIIDARHLYWTDGKTVEGKTIEGREPRHIDMELATMEGKTTCYEIYFQADTFATPGHTISHSTKDLNLDEVLPPTVIYTVNGDPVEDQIQALADALTLLGYTVVNCENKLTVCHYLPEEYIFVTHSTGLLHFVPINHYPIPFVFSYTTLYKPSPKNPPRPVFYNNTDILGRTKVWRHTFQFIYRYIYYNGVRSVWSPISYVPTNFIFGGPTVFENSDAYNEIQLFFDDVNLDNAGPKTFIRHIEIGVRYGEDEPFYSAAIIPISEMGITTHVFKFYNDRLMNLIPSDDNTTADLQVLKNFDKIYRVTNAIETVTDSKGNINMVLAGGKSGFNMPECFRATYEFLESSPDLDVFPDPQDTMLKAFKAFGTYSFGAIFEDALGRQSSVYDLFTITFTQAGGLYPVYTPIQFSFPDALPLDITTFRLVCTKNQNQAVYVQTPVINADYFKWSSPSNELTQTTYAAGDATYVGLQFNLDELAENNVLNFFDRQLPNNAFIPASGDRVRIVVDETGSITGLETYDFEILGYCIGSPDGVYANDTFWVFIKFDPAYIDFQTIYIPLTVPTDFLIAELYTPYTINEKIYYELPTAVHTNLAGGGFVPDFTLVNIGDTYVRNKVFNLNNIGTDKAFNIETPYLYLNIKKKGGDWGRPHVEDPDFRETYRYNETRISDVYIPDTNTNGLHSYKSLDFFTIDRRNGAIQRAIFTGDTLNLICRHRIQPVYVGSDRVMTRDGQNLAVTNNRFNVGNALMQQWGTQNPESVVFDNGYIYGWDRQSKVFWRKSNEGLTALSGRGLYSFFQAVGRGQLILGENFDRAQVGIDRRHNTIMVTFNRLDNTGTPYTIFYSESKDGWYTYASFKPVEGYGWIGTDYVSFKNGVLWKHESEEVPYNNFYGAQFSASMKFAFNPSPEIEKIIHNIKIHADQMWDVLFAKVPDNALYPMGQTSQIKASHFVDKEGSWRADFMRNINDESAEFTAISDPSARQLAALTRGETLRGQVFEITLQNEFPEILSCLRRVDIEYSPSYPVI